MISKDSKICQKIPKIPNNSKELISKEYFALKEPARTQKANGSSLLFLVRIKDLEKCLGA